MTAPMTPGQEALTEAMRLEQARIYGHVQREHKNDPPVPVTVPADLFDHVLDAIDRGWPNSRIMVAYRVDYETMRRARKVAMRRRAS